MMRMKNMFFLFCKWISKAIFAGVITICILSVFSWIYSYSGIHIKNDTGATDYTWEGNQKKSNMVEGFSQITMDENGFNNAFKSNASEIDILLMGSSHMEGYNVDVDENTGYLLNNYIPGYYTYNIGVSGHDIYRCVDNLDDALQYYHPSKYVIIESSTIDYDIDKMKSVIQGTANIIPSYDSGIIYYLQKIPAFTLFYRQFDLWTSNHALFANNGDIQIENSSVEIHKTEEYNNTLRDFLSMISDAAEIEGVLPILLFVPEEQLGENGKPIYVVNDEMLQIYKNICEEKGIIFINMRDSFIELYSNKKVMAHGFSNTEVGVGHLNEFGHETIALKLRSVISEVEGK